MPLTSELPVVVETDYTLTRVIPNDEVIRWAKHHGIIGADKLARLEVDLESETKSQKDFERDMNSDEARTTYYNYICNGSS